MGTDDNNWLVEYEAFLNAENTIVPGKVSTVVFARMQELINPKAWIVFLKILAAHLVTGFLSLGICHQFGLNPFGTEQSLDQWLMSLWGHSPCMIFCGIFFIALSFLIVGYFLSIEEVKVIKRNEFVQVLSLGLISLSIFAFFGAELVFTFAALWLLGVLIGGFLATEVVWILKRKLS